MVRGINDMYLENYKNTGAEFILGTGKFIAPSMVEVALADGTRINVLPRLFESLSRHQKT